MTALQAAEDACREIRELRRVQREGLPYSEIND